MSGGIGIVGGGNMAQALIGGLIDDGTEPSSISVSEPNAGTAARVREKFGVDVVADNAAVAANVGALILAVKPQVMRTVARGLRDFLPSARPLVVSIAAGIRSDDLESWLGGTVPVVRVMPNTPALVRKGVSALLANDAVTDDQRALAEKILSAVGTTLWVTSEAQIDAVTAISGSGPAYYFLVMEALAAGGVELGLAADTARRLSVETALGAAALAIADAESLASLRERVTSPGGTTEAAMRELMEGRLPDIFNTAVRAAYNRAQELARDAGESGN